MNAMETTRNPISGAEMIVPSTDLARRLGEALDCVSIPDWEQHSDAFEIQQEMLRTLEAQGVQAAKDHVMTIRNEIEAVFSEGTMEKVLALLSEEGAE